MCVPQVSSLIDRQGNDITHLIAEGDTIISLNGKGVKSPQEVLFGLINSVAVVSVGSQATGQAWDVEIRRHMPLHSWVAWHGNGGIWKGLEHISSLQSSEFQQVAPRTFLETSFLLINLLVCVEA